MKLVIENHGTLTINVLESDDDLIGDEWEEDDPDPGEEYEPEEEEEPPLRIVANS